MRRSINGRADASQPAGAKLTLLVGHDTNLANASAACSASIGRCHPIFRTRRAAGARCISNCCAVNKPASIACESVPSRRHRSRCVRRHRSIVAHPPERATASIEGCATSAGGTRPWTVFDALASKAIDRALAQEWNNGGPPPQRHAGHAVQWPRSWRDAAGPIGAGVAKYPDVGEYDTWTISKRPNCFTAIVTPP